MFSGGRELKACNSYRMEVTDRTFLLSPRQTWIFRKSNGYGLIMDIIGLKLIYYEDNSKNMHVNTGRLSFITRQGLGVFSSNFTQENIEAGSVSPVGKDRPQNNMNCYHEY